jgi:hypothetical protein
MSEASESSPALRAGFTPEEQDALCLALGRIVFQWSFVEMYTAELIQALVPVSGRLTSILTAGTPLDAQLDSIDALLNLNGAHDLRSQFRDQRQVINRLKGSRNAAVHSGWSPSNERRAEPISIDSRGRKARASPGFVVHFEGGLSELEHLRREIEQATEGLDAILCEIWRRGLHLE